MTTDCDELDTINQHIFLHFFSTVTPTPNEQNPNFSFEYCKSKSYFQRTIINILKLWISIWC